MDRNVLRSGLRAKRRAFAAALGAFPMRPEMQPWLRAAHCVGLYRAMGSEADISGWTDWLTREGVAIALPRLADRAAPMEFRLWNPGEPLDDSRLGFMQPGATAAIAEPDLILTPMLGFDRAMNRLGQGAGHYDRYFSINPNSLRVGVAWSIQEVGTIAAERWDVPMDAVCTENEWICPPESRMAAQ